MEVNTTKQGNNTSGTRDSDVSVVYWVDKEQHINTEVYRDREQAVRRVSELVSKSDWCGINCGNYMDKEEKTA